MPDAASDRLRRARRPLADDPIIKLAILAVGGQGGGVITDWIVDLAERNGWFCAVDLGAGRGAAHRRDDLLHGVCREGGRQFSR